MPIYHFHILNDIDVPDEDGLELDNLAVAHLKAVEFVRDLASHAVRQGRLDLKHRIDIEDNEGKVLLKVTFEEAVEISR